MSAQHLARGLVALLWIMGLAARLEGAVIGQWPPTPGGNGWDLVLNGNQLYVRFQFGVTIFDVSDPSQMRRISTLGEADTRVTLFGPYLAVKGITGGLGVFRLLEMTNPASPVLKFAETNYLNELPIDLAAWPYLYRWDEQKSLLTPIDFSNPSQPEVKTPLPWVLTDFTMKDGNVLATADTNGLIRFYDFTDGSHPVRRGSIPKPDNAGLHISGTNAFLILPSSHIILFDISDLDTPRQIGEWAPDWAEPIWNFKAEGGVVLFARGGLGEAILDVTNPAQMKMAGFLPRHAGGDFIAKGSTWFITDHFTLSAYDLQNPSRPVKLGSVPTGAAPLSIRLRDHYAYLMDWGNPVKILDVENPARPIELENDLPEALTIELLGDHLLVATKDYKLQIYDTTNPRKPALRSELQLEGDGYSWPSLKAAFDQVFVGISNVLSIIDVTDTGLPRVTASFTVASPIQSLALNGKYLHVTAYGEGGVPVFDISDREHPIKVASLANGPNGFSVFTTMAAYSPGYLEIEMWDVTRPLQPIFKGAFPMNKKQRKVDWLHLGADGRLYSFGYNDPSGAITVLDISLPFAPKVTNEFSQLPGYDMLIRSNIAYIAAGSAGLLTLQLSGTPPPISLEIHPEGETHRVRWLKDPTRYSLFSAPSPMGPWTPQELPQNPTRFFNEGAFPNRDRGRFYQLRR